MTAGVGQTTDSREVLQQRVAAFGFAVAVILVLSLVSRLILGVAFGYLRGELAHPSLWAHAAAWVPVACVWLICRSRPLETRTIQVVEALGAVGCFLLSGCFGFEGTNAIEICAQQQAAEWWDTNGAEIRVHRELDMELGNLGTIQAGPAFTDR